MAAKLSIGAVAVELLTRLKNNEIPSQYLVTSLLPMYGSVPKPLMPFLEPIIERIVQKKIKYDILLFLIMCTESLVSTETCTETGQLANNSDSNVEKSRRILEFNGHTVIQILTDMILSDAVPDPDVFNSFLHMCAIVPYWRSMLLWLSIFIIRVTTGERQHTKLHLALNLLVKLFMFNGLYEGESNVEHLLDGDISMTSRELKDCDEALQNIERSCVSRKSQKSQQNPNPTNPNPTETNHRCLPEHIHVVTAQLRGYINVMLSSNKRI